jgi:hypothetical protein
MHSPRKPVPLLPALGWFLAALTLTTPGSLRAARAAPPPAAETYEELLDLAGAIAVVKITGVDRRHNPYDGPAWVKARILKNIYGTLPDGEELIFASTGSFRNSLFVRSETRIVFLVEYHSGPAPWPVPSPWHAMLIRTSPGRPPVETGFLIDETDITDVDLNTLRVFLRELDAAGGRPSRVRYAPPAN